MTGTAITFNGLRPWGGGGGCGGPHTVCNQGGMAPTNHLNDIAKGFKLYMKANIYTSVLLNIVLIY